MTSYSHSRIRRDRSSQQSVEDIANAILGFCNAMLKSYRKIEIPWEIQKIPNLECERYHYISTPSPGEEDVYAWDYSIKGIQKSVIIAKEWDFTLVRTLERNETTDAQMTTDLDDIFSYMQRKKEIPLTAVRKDKRILFAPSRLIDKILMSCKDSEETNAVRNAWYDDLCAHHGPK